MALRTPRANSLLRPPIPVFQPDDIVELPHPVFGTVKMQNAFPKLSDTPGSVRRPAPLLGQHTEEILREAGFEEEEIRSLS